MARRAMVSSCEFSPARGELAEGKRRAVEPGSIQGIILAGVHAWGCCSLERVAARPLVPIAGRPLIAHTLSWLREGGITSASICANSDTVFLRRCLGTGHELRIELDYYEDVMPRGPAGCTRDAVADGQAALFVVAEGTIVPRIDLTDLLEHHEAANATLTIVAARSGAAGAGSEQLLEPVGIYVCSRRALAYIPETGYQDIKEALIPRLHAGGERVATYVVDGDWAPRVTGSASYLAVSKWVLGQMARRRVCPEGYARRGEAWVHESAQVASTVRLLGPVLIEPGCAIEGGAAIVGPAVIGSGCTLAGDAVVSRSVLWNDCQVGAGATLDHCVLTDHAIIDADAMVRNTVCVPPARGKASTLIERLSSYCWPARDGASILKRLRGSHGDGAAAEGETLVDTASYQPVASSAAVGKSRDVTTSIEGEIP